MDIKATQSIIEDTKLGTLGVYNIIKSKLDSEPEVTLPLHFVQTYDRSGSMYGDIKDLVKNIKETLKLMDEGDFLTVLWYSGRKQNGVVIEGHRVTKTEGELEYLESLLKKHNTTLGCTMYSEVIDLANSMITKYSNLSGNAAISFFTDGGVNEESKKSVFESVERIVANPNCMSFNTIGYGRYYDADILKDMAALSPQGQYFHNTNIKDYLESYSKKIEINKGYSVGTIDIKNVDNKELDVFFMTDNTSTVKTLKPNETIQFRASKRDAKILTNGKISIDVKDVDFNETSILSPDIDAKKVRKDSFEKIVYGMANAYYQANKRDNALDLIEFDLKDLNLYRKLANAFTTTEVGEASEFAKRAFADSDARQPNTITGSISDGISVIQILNKASDLDMKFDINVVREGYKNISQKREVEQNLFVETTSENIIPVSDIKFNTKGKLNASVLLTRNGYLDLTQVDNKPKELDEQFFTRRYNNYNIIQDGSYRASTLPIISDSNIGSKEFKEFLFNNGVEFESKGTLININMTGIPMVTRSEAKQFNSMEKFADVFLESEVQKLKTYVIKQTLDILKKESGATKGEVTAYSDETKAFLKDIGIDYAGNYAPKQGAAIPMTDIFEYRLLGFELNGLKTTTGKINEYYDYTPGAKVSQIKLILNKCYKEVEKEIKDTLKVNIKDIVEGKYQDAQKLFDTINPYFVENKELSAKLSRSVEGVRFGKVITGSFFDDLKKDEKDNFYVDYKNPILGDGKIIVSVEKITEGGQPSVDNNIDDTLTR